MAETQALTLADFLLARIAEDEAAARAAIEPDHLYPYADRSLPRRRPEDMPEDVIGYLGGSWGEHFARWASLRVLAECEAKRRIVKLHSPRTESYEFEHLDEEESALRATQCPQCGYAETWEIREYGPTFPCPTLRALAVPYADHPDYRKEWRP